MPKGGRRGQGREFRPPCKAACRSLAGSLSLGNRLRLQAVQVVGGPLRLGRGGANRPGICLEDLQPRRQIPLPDASWDPLAFAGLLACWRATEAPAQRQTAHLPKPGRLSGPPGEPQTARSGEVDD